MDQPTPSSPVLSDERSLRAKENTSKARPLTKLDLRAAAAEYRPSIPELSHLREAAIVTWRGRMINEHGSARVFEALAEQLRAAGLSESILAQCRSFAAEERHHGVLCGAVVEALGGEATAHVEVGPLVPAHEDAASALEAALRNVLSVCCLSETVAVALIGAERLEMPEGELRKLLTRIYADEVGHSRFGWRLLGALAPSLDETTRSRLGDYLVVALEHLVEHELAHLPITSEPPAEGAVYGLCCGKDARALFFDTIETIIVPGLEHHKIPAKRAWSQARQALSGRRGNA
jgi:hypothetical protein